MLLRLHFFDNAAFLGLVQDFCTLRLHSLEISILRLFVVSCPSGHAAALGVGASFKSRGTLLVQLAVVLVVAKEVLRGLA